MINNAPNETKATKLHSSARSALVSVVIPLVSAVSGIISFRIFPAGFLAVLILGFFAQIFGLALSVISVVAGFRYRAGGVLTGGLIGFVMNGFVIYCVFSIAYFFTHLRC